MVRSLVKKNIAILLAVIMTVVLLPISSNADALPGHGVNGLDASYTGKATWSASAGTITGSVTTTSSSGCNGTTYAANDGTLTLKNTLTNKATLHFDVTANPSGGTVKINDSTSFGSSPSFLLESNQTVTVYIKSSTTAANTTTVTLSNITLTEDSAVSLSFFPAAGGSYTVDGTDVTTDGLTVEEHSTTTSVSLSATPATGYVFEGWYYTDSDGNYLGNPPVSFNSSSSVSVYFTEACFVRPRFVSSSLPMFDVSGIRFADLKDAIDYATGNSLSTIIQVSDGTLPAGNYTIPPGITLVIPYGENSYSSSHITTPATIDGTYTAPSKYRLMTMASGAHIVVKGNLVVDSKINDVGQGGGANSAQANTSHNGTPAGPHGRINMATGSSITVNSGGNLTVWGYISAENVNVLNAWNNQNDPAVKIMSGATLRECFQIRDWRGGSYTKDLAYDNSQYEVFPFSQYYVQNVEVPLEVKTGGQDLISSGVFVNSELARLSDVKFIGPTGSFFALGTGSSLTRKYDAVTDRIIYDVSGDMTLTGISFSYEMPLFLGLTTTINVSSNEFVMPVNSNFTINVHSGTTTVSSSQPIEMLPCSELNIDNGASVRADGRLYLVDADDWVGKGYVFSGMDLQQLDYVAVKNGKPATRTITTDNACDPQIDVNGTLSVGEMYSAGDASIISSEGTGEIHIDKNTPLEGALYHSTGGTGDGQLYSASAEPASLHNEDEDRPDDVPEYISTSSLSAGDVVEYDTENHMWRRPVTIIFDLDGGVGNIANIKGFYGDTVNAPTVMPVKYGYTFGGWDPAIPSTMPADVLTIKAKWNPKSWNGVPLDPGDGEGGPTSIDVVFGEPLEDIDPDDFPYLEGHDFIGYYYNDYAYIDAEGIGDIWDIDIDNEEETVILVAEFDPVPFTYTINYYLKGTTTKVANSKTGQLLYGSTLRVTDPTSFLSEFSGLGLHKIDGQTESIVIGTGSNVVNIYYDIPITITAASNEWTYDGQPHSNSNVTVSSGSLRSGDVLSAEATGSVTNVSDNANGNNPVASGYCVTRDGAAVPYYTITAVAGTLTINRKAVTVTARNASKTYGDSDPASFQCDVDGMVEGEPVSLLTFGTRRDAGEDVNTYTITPYGDALQGNYSVSYVPGVFTINKKALTITAKPQSYVKNFALQGPSGTYGSDTLDSVITMNPETLPFTDYLFSVDVIGQQQLAGYYESEIIPSNAVIKNEAGTNVTDNYEITYEYGDLNISEAAAVITFTTSDGEYKVFYNTFADALEGRGGNEDLVIELLMDVTEEGYNPYELPYGHQLKVKKTTELRTQSFSINVVAPDSPEGSTYALYSSTDTNGITTYRTVDAVAMVGDTPYATVRDAIVDCADGALIEVINDSEEYYSTLTINYKSLTIELNGHTVNFHSDVGTSYPDVSQHYTSNIMHSTFTVQDSSEEQTGLMTTEKKSLFHVGAGGHVIVLSGKYTSAGFDGVAYLGNGGILDVRGGILQANNQGVTTNVGSVIISGGSIISNNSAGVNLGSNAGNSLTMEGGSITGKAQGVIMGNGTATISGGMITGTNGNGITINGGNATVSGGTITGKTNGISITNGSLVINDDDVIVVGQGTADTNGAVVGNSDLIEISAGGFSHYIPLEYCADGTICTTVIRDGYYRVVTKRAVTFDSVTFNDPIIVYVPDGEAVPASDWPSEGSYANHDFGGWFDINNVEYTAAVTIVSADVVLTAKWIRHIGTITVTVTTDEPVDRDRTFICTVTGSGAAEGTVLTVLVTVKKDTSSGSVTIDGLPTGAYTVTQISAWSFDFTGGAAAIVNLEKNASVTAAITETMVRRPWLYSESYMTAA